MIYVTEENRAAFRLRMRDLAERYRKIAAEFEVLAENGRPSEAEMATAPWLSGWRVDARMDAALLGVANTHPVLGEGRLITTSWLVGIDHGAGWARTESRVYRLGEPAKGGKIGGFF
jgi:hypothetical protein